FTPIARPTSKWKKAYKRRTAIERVNSRIDQVLHFEHHTIRGQAKMETRVTLALIVMLAMALGRIRANQADLMRSLTAPVRRAS
ncbi:MAG: transposase, partial [Deltaproteobacteria bacterium]|nr:transposase [Deltaproteobacteria bacterium]